MTLEEADAQLTAAVSNYDEVMTRTRAERKAAREAWDDAWNVYAAKLKESVK